MKVQEVLAIIKKLKEDKKRVEDKIKSLNTNKKTTIELNISSDIHPLLVNTDKLIQHYSNLEIKK
jgi:ribosomal protein L31